MENKRTTSIFTYFIEQPYAPPPKYRPLLPTCEQVKLFPIIYSDAYHDRRYEYFLNKWYDVYNEELDLLFNKFLSRFKRHQIKLNTDIDTIYNDFIETMYYYYMS